MSRTISNGDIGGDQHEIELEPIEEPIPAPAPDPVAVPA